MIVPPNFFWSYKSDELLHVLESRPDGLTDQEAKSRSEIFGPNLLHPKTGLGTLELFLSQFKSPIILMLLFASGLSFFLQDATDALIILLIVAASGILSFWQEKGANNSVKKLLSLVQVKTMVRRDKKEQEIPIEEVVPGDIIILNAGDVIPGDCLLLSVKDLFVDEATLTGETFPVEKSITSVASSAATSKRSNTIYMGTHVVSGEAEAVVVHTGKMAEFGKISQRLSLSAPETEFETGVKKFGYFLLATTVVLVTAIFLLNWFLAKPILESLLFALALAVGLTPQLLPAIIGINLARGASRMAKDKVIVKRLSSIENFGSMNVLCADKTGTLTEGLIKIDSVVDFEGQPNEKAFRFAFLNSYYETSLSNPIDKAVRASSHFDVSETTKLDEIPYDFSRKRLSVLVSDSQNHTLITKGSVENVLGVCSEIESVSGKKESTAKHALKIQNEFQKLATKGFRVIAVAYKSVGTKTKISKADEKDLTFLGFVVLSDPPKFGIEEIVSHLSRLGVALKIITGDNTLVGKSLAEKIGMAKPQILTGAELAKMNEEDLIAKVNKVTIFSEVEPNQKERIILALKKAGNVVGFLGDGINDAPALHAADVGISVNSGVDVAKEAASIVLLEKSLRVLKDGVIEGRRTFANTLKYVFVATSTNFGNMFSVAGASLLLPFLPLLPKQILLLNLLTDFPEMTIATDNVDATWIERPRRWNMKFIRNFMLLFGPISSIFDYLTFGVLFLLRVSVDQFRTGWFLESIVSAAIIVLIVRSRKTFFQSAPSRALLATTLAVVIFGHLLPFLPISSLFGFTPLPSSLIILIDSLVLVYVLVTEFAKKLFYAKLSS